MKAHDIILFLKTYVPNDKYSEALLEMQKLIQGDIDELQE